VNAFSIENGGSLSFLMSFSTDDGVSSLEIRRRVNTWGHSQSIIPTAGASWRRRHAESLSADLSSPNVEEASLKLLPITNNFIQAVVHLDKTVLLPSRLCDVQMPVTSLCELANRSRRDSGLSMALASTDQFDGNRVSIDQILSGADMHAVYCLLMQALGEISPSSGGSNADDSRHHIEESLLETKELEPARQLFRYHLYGLQSVLRQLTSSAKTLATYYDDCIMTDQTIGTGLQIPVLRHHSLTNSVPSVQDLQSLMA